MSKKEWCWMLVRLLGVGLLLVGLRSTANVLESVFVMPAGDAGRMLLAQSAPLLGCLCVEALASFAAGTYLLKDGRLLFAWLSDEPHET